MTDDQFSFWAAALREGRRVETQPGNPRSGFYKIRDRNPDRSVRFDCVAIWREPDGELCCTRTGRPAPTHADEIDTLFSYCAATPISHDLYTKIAAGEPWPEEVAAIGPVQDPDKPPHEAAAAELAWLRDQATAWIKEIGAVKTQEQADKCGAFADAFAKIETKATAAHKIEKAPHLEAGRLVDSKWKATIEKADECKRWSKKASESFLIAERNRLAEEARKAEAERVRIAAEAERARIEAEKASAPPPVDPEPAPVAPPPPVKAKAGTGRGVTLRTRTINEITDRRALLAYIADLNIWPGDFEAVLKVMINKMVAAGIEVPGVTKRQIEEAA